MHIDIDHIAKLARLRLSPEEHAMLEVQLPAILEYVGKLQKIDTSQIDAKAYLTDAVNVFRADEERLVSAEEHDALVRAFPKQAGGALQVPGVFE